MNYNFFANRADKIKVLSFIFDETDLRLFDCYSRSDESLSEYKTVNDVIGKFDLESGGQSAVTFHLWSPRFSSEMLIQKIDLDPVRCNGHTFRFASIGFGLIQLHFGGLQADQLNYSHIGHQTEKRAATWENTVSSGDLASNWAWTEIAKTARKLKAVIHNKWAVDKIGSLGIMSGAKELENQGKKMGYFTR